jgi:type II secretory pathway component PulJ
MLHEQIDHLAEENERLRAELERLDELQRVIARVNQDKPDCGPNETSCWRPSAA